MNKNNIIGFLLIAVVLIGFSWYNQPSAEEQRAAFVQDSIAKAKHAEMEKASFIPSGESCFASPESEKLTADRSDAVTI